MNAKKDQLRLFKEAAKESGADESGEAFECAFKKIVPPKRAVRAIGAGNEKKNKRARP